MTLCSYHKAQRACCQASHPRQSYCIIPHQQQQPDLLAADDNHGSSGDARCVRSPLSCPVPMFDEIISTITYDSIASIIRQYRNPSVLLPSVNASVAHHYLATAHIPSQMPPPVTSQLVAPRSPNAAKTSSFATNSHW